MDFDCGCDNRREIMGSENWQLDAGVIVGALAIAFVLYLLTK